MSEGNAQAGVLYIAEKGSIAMMRVQGSGVRNLAEGFDKWIDYLADSSTVGCIIVDMADCTYMDSTFMGMLVKLVMVFLLTEWNNSITLYIRSNTMCTISCKVDDDVKTNSEAIFESLGITMSAAINMFLRATIREEGLPINTKLKTRDELILERLKEAENPDNLSPVFSSMEEAKAWLNA